MKAEDRRLKSPLRPWTKATGCGIILRTIAQSVDRDEYVVWKRQRGWVSG